MGWTGVAGLIVLTTALGGFAAAVVSRFLIESLHVSHFEGGSGYFALFVTGIGIGGGFLTGAIVAAARPSDFTRALVWSVGIIAAIALLGAFLPPLLRDKGDLLDGEKLVLQLELQMPAGWKRERNREANRKGDFCWLQRDALDDPKPLHGIRSGSIELQQRENGVWIAVTAFDLSDSIAHRFVRIFSGNTVNISVVVPLPTRPDRRFTNWSEWTSSGLYAQEGATVPSGFTFRFRVQTEAEHQHQFPGHDARLAEYRRVRTAGLSKQDPLQKWLFLFDGPDGKPEQPANPDAARELLNKKVAEMPALLASKDPDTRRRAIYAAAHYYPKLPPSLEQPLAGAADLVVELMQTAGKASPDEPDFETEELAYQVYVNWVASVDQSNAQAPVFRQALEKIAQAAGAGPSIGRIHEIAESAQKRLAGGK